MAGSFDLFRKYQRSLLVFVAILAMLAFFVLPPFLQMGSSAPAGDPVAVHWSGGDVREDQLERSVAMRSVLNRFLVESAVAAGRDPSQLPLFPDNEQAVIRSMLVGEEGRKNGLVVSDVAINEFLADWTNNLVRQEKFNEILAGLRLGPMAVSQRDLFETLRAELLARNTLMMFQAGFSGDPPGWRWDYFKRMEQAATIEAVGVPVGLFADQVAPPSEQTLRAFYEKYKEDLPDARSENPGFREPRRVKFETLVARRETFVEEAAQAVTDAEILEFYEKNKTAMFRAKPATEAAASQPAAPAAEAPAAEAPAAPTPETQPAAAATAAPAAVKEPPAAAPAAETPPPAVPAAEAPATPEVPATPAPAGAALPQSPFRQVAFKQPAAAETPAADASAPQTAEAAPASPAAEPAAPVEVQPLEEVKDKIRDQLAQQKANIRIDNVFAAVAKDLTDYAADLALWQAQQIAGREAPRAPDFDKIASVQGLQAVRSELVTAQQAFDAGGVGRSFDFVADPGSRFGVRQLNWLETMYGPNTLSLRPVTTRDFEGNRYLSWKTEDQPEFVPSFTVVRANVEKAWRMVEARGLAAKQAQDLISRAATQKEPLGAVIAGQPALQALQAVQVGPFPWVAPEALANGNAAPSQPEGLSFPGNDFMRTLFALEAGGAGVAFNEPRTVCYAFRMLSLDPPEQVLKERFVEGRADQRRIGMVAQGEFTGAFQQWMEGVEKRYDLQWKRPPRR